MMREYLGSARQNEAFKPLSIDPQHDIGADGFGAEGVERMRSHGNSRPVLFIVCPILVRHFDAIVAMIRG